MKLGSAASSDIQMYKGITYTNLQETVDKSEFHWFILAMLANPNVTDRASFVPDPAGASQI